MSSVPEAANPYAAPTAPGPSIATAGTRLFTANHVALATFLGTPLGGGVLLAMNESRLGRSQKVLSVVALGFGLSAAMIAISLALPENVPGAPLGIGAMLGMRALAVSRQGALLEEAFRHGSRPASGWAAAGIGVLVAIPFAALAVGAAFLGE